MDFKIMCLALLVTNGKAANGMQVQGNVILILCNWRKHKCIFFDCLKCLAEFPKHGLNKIMLE
jgi:hypothetical protein